jgi:SAM-dependent methyltransferase
MDTAVAYDTLAPAYDALTADYCHDRWVAALLRLAAGYGLTGNRALDLACGTGKSFLPLLAAGWRVTAADVSPQMTARAARKAPQVEVLCRDVRTMGRVGAFDLVTCLDDALNYLTEWADLRSALATVAANLAPGGVAIWDHNTLSMYRSAFASDWITERDGYYIAWKGLGDGALQPGERTSARVAVFERAGGGWRRTSSVHAQRHWPAERVRAAAAAAGLDVVAVHGQSRGARLDDHVDEAVHTKVVYFARPRTARKEV